MIHSTSPSPGSSRANAIAAYGGPVNGARKTPPPATDTLTTDNAESLKRALESTPEVRPEMVELGRHLAVDPTYPPRQIIEKLAQLMANSIDPSEQSS